MHPWGESNGPHWELDAFCPDGLVLLESVRGADGAVADFSFRHVSPAAERMLGHEKGALKGQRLLLQMPWAQEAGFFEACLRVRQHRAPDLFEVSRPTPLGRTWLRSRALPWEEGVVLFIEDITERYRGEEALRRDRNLLQAVIESTTDAVFVKDLEGRYTLVNAAAAHALGRAPDSILGRTDAELREPTEATAAMAHDKSVWAQGRTATYEEAEAGPSVLRQWQTTKGVLRNPGGAPYALFAMSRDITARKRAEQQVRESEERYRLVSRATNDVIWDWDLNVNEVRWNQALHTVLGYSPDEAARAPFQWWLECIHPEDRERVFDALESVGHLGDSWAHEYRCLRADQSYATVLERGYVARDRDGRPLRLLGSLMDMTERRRREEEREQEAAFRERFMGVLGHDLGNPLAAIRLSAKGLLRKANLSDDLRPALARIDSSADRMARLVSQLLDFSRARMAGGIQLSRQALSLDELCDRVISELEVAYPERRIVMQVQGNRVGFWDGGRLSQVLSNLVANALEHSPRDSDVEVFLTDEEGTQRVEVHNGGPPIPERLRDCLFEPFRGARSQQGPARQAGLGLGLYIVREIVLAHSGQVDVSSTLEDGTRFILRLPRLVEEEEPREARTPFHAGPARAVVASRTPPPSLYEQASLR